MSDANAGDSKGERQKIILDVIAGVWSLDGKTSLKERKKTNLVVPMPLIGQPGQDR